MTRRKEWETKMAIMPVNTCKKHTDARQLTMCTIMGIFYDKRLAAPIIGRQLF